MNKIDERNTRRFMKSSVGESDFCRWLYTSIRDKNWNAPIVAERLKTTRQTITNHVSGKLQPSYANVIAYCWLFGEADVDKIYSLLDSKSSL